MLCGYVAFHGGYDCDDGDADAAASDDECDGDDEDDYGFDDG